MPTPRFDVVTPRPSRRPVLGHAGREAWPPLPLGDWEETYDTLHMWTQIVGKTRLALSPPVNHWWQSALYVTSRGLGTSPMPYGNRIFEIELDFLDHALVARVSDGASATMPLARQPVADFFHKYTALLGSLGLEVQIWPMPVEVIEAIPFEEDRKHAAYDPEAVRRYLGALQQADRVLKEFRGRFVGKCSPVHFFWGAFDLACTRFSGRRAPLHAGGVPHCPDYVQQEAYSHECSSAGFWPGGQGSPIREAAFYSYAYPEPEGFRQAPIHPREARYVPELGEFLLPYEAVRTADDPDRMLLDFFETTYEAAATLARWDRAGREVYSEMPTHH